MMLCNTEMVSQRNSDLSNVIVFCLHAKGRGRAGEPAGCSWKCCTVSFVSISYQELNCTTASALDQLFYYLAIQLPFA